MFNWARRKKSKLLPLKVFIPTTTQQEAEYKGIFEYQCIIKCHVLNSEYYVTVLVNNDLVIPRTMCPCGKKLNLYQAPIINERKLGDQIFRTRRGEMTSIHTGNDHVVRLGRTFRYEIAP